jgi:class 3 adenylate cyclase
MMSAREINEEIRNRRGVPQEDGEDYFAIQIGMATGEVLDLGGYNAFGDPVNTAFKLGEDVAQPWDLLLNISTTNGLPPAMMEPFELEKRHKDMSKVTIKYSAVNWKESAAVKVNVEEPLLAAKEKGGVLNRVDWKLIINK